MIELDWNSVKSETKPVKANSIQLWFAFKFYLPQVQLEFYCHRISRVGPNCVGTHSSHRSVVNHFRTVPHCFWTGIWATGTKSIEIEEKLVKKGRGTKIAALTSLHCCVRMNCCKCRRAHRSMHFGGNFDLMVACWVPINRHCFHCYCYTFIINGEKQLVSHTIT